MLRASLVSSPIMGKGVFYGQASLWRDRRLGSLAITFWFFSFLTFPIVYGEDSYPPLVALSVFCNYPLHLSLVSYVTTPTIFLHFPYSLRRIPYPP